MDIENIAEYKERMLIAKQQGDMENFNKYYKLFVQGYKELTGEDFEEVMKNKLSKEKNNKNENLLEL